MKVNDKFRLDGRVSLVTGGAAGLGKAMAQGLAQAGSRLVIADIDLMPLAERRRSSRWKASRRSPFKRM